MRFDAIDGLRGWLAWAVVLNHVVQFTKLDMSGQLGAAMGNIGTPAVLVFIVISGFVICGRVIEIKEPWWPYIIRRGFRIFPLYLFLLPFAAFLLPFALSAFELMQWADSPSNGLEVRSKERVDLLSEHPIALWLLHLGLSQGVIPDSIWPRGSTALLPPSWSLSLEWQYYLIAPVFVWLLASKKFAAATIAGVLILTILFKFIWPNAYIQPSFLVEAAYIFMVGILSRLWFERLQRFALPSVWVVGVLLVGLIFSELRWLAIWAAMLVYLLNRSRWNHEFIGRAIDTGLKSKAAIYFGERSYSTYLAHFPIMYGLLIVLVPLELSMGTAIVVFIISAFSLTAIAAHLLYRFIERPFIRIGSRIAKRQIAVSA